MLTASNLDIELLSIKSLPCVQLTDRRDLPDAPGVYFVVDERCSPVYYIGQAESIKKRWIQHNKIQVFEHYDSAESPMFIYYLEIEGSQVDRLAVESRAIKHFVPLMNYQTRGFCKQKDYSGVDSIQVSKKNLDQIVEDRLKVVFSDLQSQVSELKQNQKTVREAIQEYHEKHVKPLLLPGVDLQGGRGWADRGDYGDRWLASISNTLLRRFSDQQKKEFDDEVVPTLRCLLGFLDAAAYSLNEQMYSFDEHRKKVANLLSVAILNRWRMEFLFDAELISENAKDRCIGVGSVFSVNSDPMICLSESIDGATSLLSLFDASEKDEATPKLKTVEYFGWMAGDDPDPICVTV